MGKKPRKPVGKRPAVQVKKPSIMRPLDPTFKGTLQLIAPKSVPMSELSDFRVAKNTPLLMENVYQGETKDLQVKILDAKKLEDMQNDENSLFMVVPQPEAPTTDILWHYTNTDGLLGIITSRTMRATSITFLNDQREYQYGHELLASIMLEVRESGHIHPMAKRFIEGIVELAIKMRQENELYLVCASEAEDSLSQWRGYSATTQRRGLGHSIGLDRKFVGVVVEDPNHALTQYMNVQSLRWAKVVYDEAAQRNLLIATLGFCAASVPTHDPFWTERKLIEHRRMLAGIVLESLLHCKHISFSEEREVRLVFSMPPGSPSIRHRAGNYGVVPYLSIGFINPNVVPATEAPPRSTAQPEPLPIQTIMVGPDSDAILAVSGLKSLLATEGYPTVDIRLSGIPYR